MLKKTITYTDYNGTKRTEDFYFHLNKAEIIEMELSISGGLTTKINNIIAAQDTPAIVKMFKDLILKAYGVKSDDGKQFIKKDELTLAFVNTEAYAELFTELATDDKAASEFINGIIPANVAEQLKQSNIESPLIKQG